MTDQLSDRELAESVISSGDEAAFEALYDRHTPSIYGFLLRLTAGDATEAEDLMQETWLRAARGLAGFQWRSAFRTWVIGIALNQFRELSRRNGRRITTVEETWEVPGNVMEPGVRMDLERALRLLPPGFRTVLVLHDVEGFTHRDIGKRLGINEGTSKSQLHEARRAMRRLLSTGPETT
jgi:RNA polymerase sigma-70 factor (ECF subfamily)